MRLSVKVIPRAKRNEVAGWAGDRLRVRVAAAPEKGRANRALEAYLAELLGVARRDVRVIAGQASPHKIVEITGLDEAEAARRLPAREPR